MSLAQWSLANALVHVSVVVTSGDTNENASLQRGPYRKTCTIDVPRWVTAKDATAEPREILGVTDFSGLILTAAIKSPINMDIANPNPAVIPTPALSLHDLLDFPML